MFPYFPAEQIAWSGYVKAEFISMIFAVGELTFTLKCFLGNVLVKLELTV